jgi:hypothetical protein
MKNNVYHLVFKSENGIKLKNIGYIEKDIVSDEFLERYRIINEINGEIMRCNLLEDFIRKNKRLPFYYIDIVKETKTTQQTLARIFIYYDVSEDIKIETYLKGKFVVELDYEGETKILEEVDEIKNMRRFLDKIIEFIQTKEMREIFTELKIKNKEEIKPMNYETPKVNYSF